MSRVHRFFHGLRTLPADARLGFRHERLRGVWKALAGRSLHHLVRSGRLIVFAQALDRATGSPLPSGISITRLDQGYWNALGSLVGRRELDQFRALLANGRHCLVAWRGEKPVGYAWVAEVIGPDVAIWPLPLEVPERTAYLWKLYVVPSERCNGIGSALAKARLQLARELGFRQAWRMVAPSNAASLRTVQKSATGTRVVGKIRFVQLLNRTYTRFTPYGAEDGELN